MIWGLSCQAPWPTHCMWWLWGHQLPLAGKQKFCLCCCCKPKTTSLVLSPLILLFFLSWIHQSCPLKPASYKSRITMWVAPLCLVSLRPSRWEVGLQPCSQTWRPCHEGCWVTGLPLPEPRPHRLLHCNPYLSGAKHPGTSSVHRGWLLLSCLFPISPPVQVPRTLPRTFPCLALAGTPLQQNKAPPESRPHCQSPCDPSPRPPG